ncbi:MAG TPA: hypothetical protein VIG79_01130 [Lapillicoccus sp.]|uniref:hypothetical protein n=1 Tax=Lapillicoccus sp. TaxID=1909287 RepID=UPI002F95BEE2
MAALPRLAPAFGPASGPDLTGAVTSTAAAGVSGRFVVVDGAGPLSLSVATLLRAAGVGLVRAGAWAADTLDAELRVGGSTGPDLLVLLAARSVDPRGAEPWRRRGVPLLPVVVDAARVVVGPWVAGDPAQPCLVCLHLTRTGHDLVGSAAAPPRPATATVDEPLVSMGAGLAAMVAVAGLGGAAIPVGVSVEVGGPWPRVEHRRWDRHTECPHHEEHEPGVVRPPPGGAWRTGQSPRRPPAPGARSR